MTGITKTTATAVAKTTGVCAISETTTTNMTTTLTHIDHPSRPQRLRRSRRRGTILVLVMAVLGLMFVAGVAFMATMNFESSIISSQRRRNQAAPAIDLVMQDSTNLLTDVLEPISSAASAGSISEETTPYVQLPGVHNLSSPIEPYVNASGQMVWPWMTDITAIQSQSIKGSAFKMSRAGESLNEGEVRLFAISALEKPGYEADVGERGDNDTDPDIIANSFSTERRTLVDADGDGVVDAVELDLASLPGGSKRRLSGLGRILNPPSKPQGTVNLGLRVVSHGGMVNVNASHPLLIGNVLGQVNTLEPPYSPAIEEPSLRRRHFLPPETLTLTQLQGSQFGKDPITGDGHYATALFPDRESPRDHRYWPFAHNELGADPDIPIWQLRMDANGANPDPTMDEYDRRHLVTTVSYSDLLRRPSLVGKSDVRKDLIDRVIEKFPTDAVTRFPLLAYPFSDIAEITATVECISGVSDPDCKLDARKGRIKFSLAWLDRVVNDPNLLPDMQLILNITDARTMLIQDAFTLLLFNARGSEWGKYVADSTDATGESTYWKPDYDAIARTAASLTANMIDFSDADDSPTAVAIRSADPDNPNFGFPASPPEDVYGLEIQPFITEVVADANSQDDIITIDGELDAAEVNAAGASSFFGVELYNPFDQIIQLGKYTLNVAGTTVGFPDGELLLSQEFKGFYSGILPSSIRKAVVLDKATLVFKDGDSIKLVQTLPSTAGPLVDVTVDRFETGASVGALGAGFLSLQRAALFDSVGKWYAPVPLDTFNLIAAPNDTFGQANDRPNAFPEGAPVELIFPDAPDGNLSTVFPTTGMLLTLMRHANSTSNAFTEALNNPIELDIDGKTPTDNGRMPIYDESVVDTNGYHAHHVDPNWDLTKMNIPAAGSGGLPTVGIEGTIGKAGGAMHLPWGQLVFDYFTAMPLDSPGPYSRDSAGNLKIDENQAPKVDMGGLRVHGQIDLNTAPWKVLEGLPFVSMGQLPAPFDNKFSVALGLSSADLTLPNSIGDLLAKAIVAYRELRVLGTSAPNFTGDYAAVGTSVSRGWSDPDPLTGPSMRRGTGFMTIGELANVRHTGATTDYRTDSGEVEGIVKVRSYMNSIAVLASLGEWLTVRPHVFTVYGTLRGEADQTIVDPDDAVELDMRVQDINSRALRFQETVDRLPAILGEPARLIGQRVIGKYHDTRSD